MGRSTLLVKNGTRQKEGTVFLALSEWELANLHLRAATTVTFYAGAAPIEFLRHRLALILGKNPWLAGRLVKATTADGVVTLAYNDSSEALPPVDDHFSAHEAEEVILSLSMSYEELVQSLLPIGCADSKLAIDADEPLFKVAVVPVEAGDDTSVTQMQSRVRLPGFALVVSMNHTVGDGHTFYSLYGMLGADAPVEALDPMRVSDFEKEKIEVVGEAESALLSSAGFGLGIVGSYLLSKLTRLEPQNVCVHTVDPAWIAREKAKARDEARVPFVSSNDALTSWFFREMKCDINLILANLRSREPSVAGLTEEHAGNYEANVPYFPGDVETPALIRQSLLGPDGGFRARRAGSPETRPPGFLTSLRNRAAIITNWAGFARDVTLGADTGQEGAQPQQPQLHLPVMRSEGMLTSIWNTGVVFRPHAGELAMLMITRRFDNDILAHRKKDHGPSVPMGQRLI